MWLEKDTKGEMQVKVYYTCEDLQRRCVGIICS